MADKDPDKHIPVFTDTTATDKLLALRKRIKGVTGGTSAGKTISILQILIDLALSDEKPTMTSVVSESMPHLKRGAMRDFLNIMEDLGYFVRDRWNKSEFTYTFESGSKLEFFSADQPSKVRGPRRQRLFMNECNNLPLETFDQLEVRTSNSIWLDWNPVGEFWWYTDVLPNRDVDFITLTYLDNEALPKSIVDSIESRKNNTSWWQVYGLGQLGEAEGLVYTGWQPLAHIPFEAKLYKRGLDFGYSNDPTAIVDVYTYNGGFIIDEQLYQKGLSNGDIANFIKSLPDPNTLVVADSSEPKSIDELRLYGINVLAANKGKGSVLQGINFIQGSKISYTKRSTNLIKEYRNYMWQKDKMTDKYINKTNPIDFMNHLLDALRYALETYSQPVDDGYDNVSSGKITSLWG